MDPRAAHDRNTARDDGARDDGARDDTAELVLAGLFLEPTEARLTTLAAAVRDATDWGGVATTLEAHGVLGLYQRNLELAGAEPPGAAKSQLEERAAALREDARRVRLTLERFLDEARPLQLDITLLKGCSLALDLYPDPALRGQGDLDLLIRPADLAAATRAGAAAGLVPGPRAMPHWWYRLTHFHLKLAPTSPLLREVELHWALQHPSLLLTPALDDVMARRTGADVAGRACHTLDPIDRLLHLVTHLWGHALDDGRTPARTSLLGVAASATHPIRLKWVVDIHAEVERVHSALAAGDVAARARDWNAETQLAHTLTWIRNALGFVPAADAWVLEVLATAAATTETNGGAAGRTHEPGPLDAFDFRARTLTRLPRWILPPTSYLRRRYGTRGAGVVIARVRHAAGVLLRGIAAVVALPIALVGRALLAPSRRAARRRATAPDQVLDVVTAWRARSQGESAGDD